MIEVCSHNVLSKILSELTRAVVLGAERKLLVQPPERTESSLGLK